MRGSDEMMREKLFENRAALHRRKKTKILSTQTRTRVAKWENRERGNFQPNRTSSMLVWEFTTQSMLVDECRECRKLSSADAMLYVA